MINTEKTDEWIREVEERPASAPLIIRYIAGRLEELTKRNEELLAENIALRTEKKVEEYEGRIANLEYQLELLKRQVGEGPLSPLANRAVESLNLILFHQNGHVLRIPVDISEVLPGQAIAALGKAFLQEGTAPQILMTSASEELLFVFNSGRTVSSPVAEIPHIAPGEPVDWRSAFLAETRGGEALSAVLPFAKMALFDCCIQSSRRGCAKKIMRASLETQIARNFIGSGVKQKPDRTGGLVFSAKDDLFVMVSQEGFLVSVDVNDLAYTAEEMLRLSATDHITSSFVTAQKNSLVVITQNGKAIVREVGWLDKGATGKSRGQPIFSQSRRDAGIRVAGAGMAGETDWGAALWQDGNIKIYPMADVTAGGSLNIESSANEILEFIIFPAPAGMKG